MGRHSRTKAVLPGADDALVQVFVDSEADVDKLSTTYDTADERAALRAAGYKIGRTIEDASTRAAVAEERDATTAQLNLAADLAEHGVPKGGAKLEGRSVVPLPGETVIQRANTFTNYAGRFLYVEAHNKASSSRCVGQTIITDGPAQALSYAGADDVYGPAVTMNVFVDCDMSPDVCMYHRHLIRLGR